MKALLFSRRSILSVMVAMVVVVLLATSASSLNRRDPGFSGVWQDWGDGVWDYYYYAPTDCEFWRFKSNLQVRFAFSYDKSSSTTGNWSHYAARHGGFFPIGQGGVSNDFLGDDHNWHAVDTDNHWSFQYWWEQDCGYWMDTTQNETRFAYKYGPGQWWDYTTSNTTSWTGWGHMGLGALTTAAFIGDGAWHTFRTANMPGGTYVWGLTDDAKFKYDQDAAAYIWKCNGVERYKFVYGAGLTGSWWYSADGSSWTDMTYGGTYGKVDVRYHGGGVFIESHMELDPGTSRPDPVPSLHNLWYGLYYAGGSSPGYWGGFKIYNPGPDDKWSNGLLNVLWCQNSDANIGFAEYTAEDVVVLCPDLASFGFGQMVNWMTVLRDYFRKQISTVMVSGHGNGFGWNMGQWMYYDPTTGTGNYWLFQSDWERWGSLMTGDGQLISLHPQTGLSTTMLYAIRDWSGMDIFANTNVTYSAWYWITGTGINPSIWNNNIRQMTWIDINGGAWDGSDRNFEFTTTGSQNYRWILYY